MNAFTIEQLLFASEILFPADYERLLRKHTKNSEDDIKYLVIIFKTQYHSSLFRLIKSIPRSNPQDLEEISVMIKDLIGDKV